MIKTSILLIALFNTPVKASILNSVCSENLKRIQLMTKRPVANQISLFSVKLQDPYSTSADNDRSIYNVILDCQNSPKLSFSVAQYFGDKNPKILTQNKITWNEKEEIFKIRSEGVNARGGITLYAKPIIQDIKTKDCNACGSQQVDGKTVWIDKEGEEIPEPKDIDLGKKVVSIYTGNAFTNSFSQGYLSPTDNPVVNAEIQDSLIKLDENAAYEAARTAGQIVEDISSNLAGLLYKAEAKFTMEAALDTKNFYQAQIFNYAEVFKALSKVSQ